MDKDDQFALASGLADTAAQGASGPHIAMSGSADADPADDATARRSFLTVRMLTSRVLATRRQRMVLYSIAFLLLFCSSYSIDSHKRKELAKKPTKLDAYKANSSAVYGSSASTTASTSVSSTTSSKLGYPPAGHAPAAKDPLQHQTQRANEALWSDLVTTTGGHEFQPAKDLPHSARDQVEHEVPRPPLAPLPAKVAPLPQAQAEAPGAPNPEVIADEVEGLIQSVEAAEAARQAAVLEASRRASGDERSTNLTERASNAEDEVDRVNGDHGPDNEPVDERESLEQIFVQATDSVKHLRNAMDEIDFRNMEALVLQARSGDCTGGVDTTDKKSLFKTDNDKATEDIDQSSAVWGAWCALTGLSADSAMQKFVDYVEYFDHRLSFTETSAVQGTPPKEPPPLLTFDEDPDMDDNSTTVHRLVDALSNPSPVDIQARVTEDVELLNAKRRVAELESLMDDKDYRFMTALFAQSTLGNCDKYLHTKIDVENLTIPKNSAAWGAWCALRKHHRSTTRVEYMKRQRYFEEQKKQADEKNASNNEGE